MGPADIIPAFTYRHNSDGTTDSICKKCFATVVTERRQGDIRRAERDHICDPEVLEYWKEIIHADRKVPLPIHR